MKLELWTYRFEGEDENSFLTLVGCGRTYKTREDMVTFIHDNVEWHNNWIKNLEESLKDKSWYKYLYDSEDEVKGAIKSHREEVSRYNKVSYHKIYIDYTVEEVK